MISSLILSDGSRERELSSTATNGVWTKPNGFKPPLVKKEGTYAESSDSEGRRRLRSRPTNPTGSAKLVISADSKATFWDLVDDLEELVESAHERKGTLRYEPSGSPAVTFDLESVQIDDMPQRGATLGAFVVEVTLEFECRPYGRLDPVTLFTGAALSGPVDSVEVEDVPGQVDAWAELTLTDGSSQQRDHVEVCLDTEFNSSDPLYVALPDLIVAGFQGASTTRSGSYSTNVVQAVLASTPVAVCSTGAMPHKGRRKIRARVLDEPTATGIYVRLAWRVGDGPFTRERWVMVPVDDDWYDLDLETIDVAEVPSGVHSWEGWIEAYASPTPQTLNVDFVEVLPA